MGKGQEAEAAKQSQVGTRRRLRSNKEMEVNEDQLDSNRPIQGVKANFEQATLAVLRPVAPRNAFHAVEGPASSGVRLGTIEGAGVPVLRTIDMESARRALVFRRANNIRRVSVMGRNALDAFGQ